MLYVSPDCPLLHTHLHNIHTAWPIKTISAPQLPALILNPSPIYEIWTDGSLDPNTY
jgi:hypothetical protein